MNKHTLGFDWNIFSQNYSTEYERKRNMYVQPLKRVIFGMLISDKQKSKRERQKDGGKERKNY